MSVASLDLGLLCSSPDEEDGRLRRRTARGVWGELSRLSLSRRLRLFRRLGCLASAWFGPSTA